LTTAYPASSGARDRWVLERRGPKRVLDAAVPYASAWEEEPDASGTPVSTAVVFLTNHECPFRCAMCDLWVNTLDVTVEQGAIPAQIRHALDELPAARQVKLYNAGSYFDPRAIPPEDDEAVAELVALFERVIVEAHPAFLDGRHADRCLRFRDRLRGRLEVAIGLETAHPETLERLNKRMTLDDFARAAEFLRRHEIDLRVFVLLRPPFLAPEQSVAWACRSLDLAAESGAVVCSVIPTRGGNGAMEALGSEGVAPAVASPLAPWLADLERVVEYGLATHSLPARGRVEGSLAARGLSARRPMRVFADVWDVERFFDCHCAPARADRLREMNRAQRPPAPVVCACEAGRWRPRVTLLRDVRL
jgi:archaeosine synthase beta-subunit